MSKNKWEITIDSMLIVGKYFQSNKDYMNVMKVSKKYNDLTQMYHFNPISDTSLFINMETQHLYTYDDRYSKKEGMHQYIYWYNDLDVLRNSKPNETIKKINPYKYITNNIKTLEKWSKKKYNRVLYDSKHDGKDASVFRDKIMDHKHLYFILFDKNNNVFGHYHPSKIDCRNKMMSNSSIFTFCLTNNNQIGLEKCDLYSNASTTIYSGDGYFGFNSHSDGWEIISSASYIWGNSYSWIFEKYEESVTATISTEDDLITPIEIKRIVVIEMK